MMKNQILNTQHLSLRIATSEFITFIISIFDFLSPSYSIFVGTAYRKMIESNEIAFRSTVLSTSMDRANSFHLGDPQNESFHRSASFMDIARQTSEQDLSITLHRDDTVMSKIYPALSKRMVKVE